MSPLPGSPGWSLLCSAWLWCRINVGAEAGDHQVGKPGREPVIERLMAHQGAEVQRRDQHFDGQGAVAIRRGTAA
jgi:hypothetical protein